VTLCWVRVLGGGAWLGANLRSCMRPTAVSPRAELCSRRQCRPGRRQLDGRRHGEKQIRSQEDGSGSARKKAGPQNGAILWPKNGRQKGEGRQSALTLWGANFGPPGGGSFLGARLWKRGIRAQGARRRKLRSRRERQHTDTIHTVTTQSKRRGRHTTDPALKPTHTCRCVGTARDFMSP